MHRQGTKVLAQTTLETGAVAPCSVGKLLAMEPSGIARKSAFWSSSTWFCAGKGGLVEIYPTTTTTTTIVNWKRYVLSIHWFTCTYLSVYLYNYRFGYLMLLIYLCIFISVICIVAFVSPGGWGFRFCRHKSKNIGGGPYKTRNMSFEHEHLQSTKS